MIRPTLRQFPVNSETKDVVGLPWGLCIAPLAPCPAVPNRELLEEQARAVIEAACAKSAPDLPRCISCGAYLCHLCRIDHAGWRCFLCANLNTLPSRYCAALAVSDRDALLCLPEVSAGMYEVPVSNETAPSPYASVFIIEQSDSHNFVTALSAAVEMSLSLLRGECFVGFVLYSATKLCFLDHCGYTLRRYDASPLTEENIADFPKFCPVGQWLTRVDAISSRTKLIHSLCKTFVAEHDFQTDAQFLLQAVNMVLRALKTCGIPLSRINCFAHDKTMCTSDAHTVLSVEDNLTTNPVTSASRNSVQLISKQAGLLGMHAMSLHSVVDIHILQNDDSRTKSFRASSIASLTAMSGGTIMWHTQGSLAFVQLFTERLKQAVAVGAYLKIRTSPGYNIGDAYGPSIHRDEELHDIFCISTGHGASSTFFTDLEFSNLEGFIGSPRAPAIQIAFQGLLLDSVHGSRSILRVQSHVFPVSASRQLVLQSADFPALTALLFHKTTAVVAERGCVPGKDFLFERLIEYVSNAMEFDWERNSDGKIGHTSANARQVLTGRVKHLRDPLDMLVYFVFGLFQSCMLDDDNTGIDDKVSFTCHLERLDPESLWSTVRLLCKFKNGGDSSSRLTFAPRMESAFNSFLQDLCDVVFINSA